MSGSTSVASIPSFRTASSFLEANAQAHDRKPLYAFGDLVDNARDADATRLAIECRPRAGDLMITLTDNGVGMDEQHLRDGVLSIAFSDKSHRAEIHYGMGSTSALPRLSPRGSLIFSRRGGHLTVGLISTTLSSELGSEELKVPQTSWSAQTRRPLSGTSAERPLTPEQRAESLRVICMHTPFGTERELLDEFARIPGKNGTRIVLFACDASAWDASSSEAAESADLICTEATKGGQDDGAEHEWSLRSFLEILYYADSSTGEAPAMGITLQGKAVLPRDWATFLQGWPDGRPPYQYDPAGLRGKAARVAAHATEAEGSTATADKPASRRVNSEYGARIRFGTTVPMRQLINVFSTKGGGDETRKAKRRLDAYSGVFYYNHSRLILPLVRAPKQCSAGEGSSMMTTTKRITLYGIGLVGVVCEGFLMPTHNKSDYAHPPRDPSSFSQPASLPSWEELHRRVRLPAPSSPSPLGMRPHRASRKVQHCPRPLCHARPSTRS